MTRIRVLHPITRLIVGGAQENTMLTAALLDKGRFYTEVLSGPQTGTEGSLIEEVKSNNIPLTILPVLVRQIHPLNDLRALKGMRNFMRHGGFTIVHTHSSKAGILGRIAARQAGVPVVVHTVHGWSFHDYMSRLERMVYILLEQYTAYFSDALIVVTKKDIEKGLGARIGRKDQYKLIRSAIPLNEFDPSHIDSKAIRHELNIPREALVIGNIGRFSPQKNPLEWVQVAAQLGRKYPQIHFLLTGDGPLRATLENALVNEGIAGRTILTGIRRDVARILAAMDIFLLTSLWEGLPRVLPQAMAMGLPVVANRIDGVVEAVRHAETGYLCTPGKLDQMVDACATLIEDPHKRAAMGRKGQEFVKQEFDLGRMIHQIESLYQNLISTL